MCAHHQDGSIHPRIIEIGPWEHGLDYRSSGLSRCRHYRDNSTSLALLGEQLSEFSLFYHSDFTYVSAPLSRFDRHRDNWNCQSRTHSHTLGWLPIPLPRCYRVIHDVAQYFGDNFASFHPISVFSGAIKPPCQAGLIGAGIVVIGLREPILSFWVHRKFRLSRDYRVLSRVEHSLEDISSTFHPFLDLFEVIKPHHQGGSNAVGLVEIGSWQPILAFWVYHFQLQP